VIEFDPATGVLSVPQPGEQVAVFGCVIVVVGAVWVISHVTPLLCKSFVSAAMKVCCSPVGTEAVVGVMPTKIPESSVIVHVAVLLVCCADVAVRVITSPGKVV